MPEGTTHVRDFYGVELYYKREPYNYFNQVSDERQNRVQWFYWDLGKWNPVEAGFCARNMKEVT